MKIPGTLSQKNLLIRRLTELAGSPASYTGAPEFAYDIGSYRVLRDGSLAVSEKFADGKILKTLIQEKLISDPYMTKEDVPSPAATPGDSISQNKARFDRPVRIHRTSIDIQTMVNLIHMISSKGRILNQALGKPDAFWVSDNIIFDLAYEKPESFYDLQRILRISDRADLLKGVEFKSDAVIFSGFPETDDLVVRSAYEKLAEGMFNYASSMKYISGKRQVIDNERYYFRCWLTHLGLGGSENRTIRAILMQHLSGNMSYRTREQLMAYNLKKKAQRQELKQLNAGKAE